MTLYSYIKAPAKGKFFFKQKILFYRVRKYLPYVFGGGGLTLITLVCYSLFSYKFLIFLRAKNSFIAPIPETAVNQMKDLVNPMVAGAFTEEQNSLPPEENKEIDYDLINNWFPTASVPVIRPSKITHYTISIPRLKISNAVVEIGGTKVKESLVQYPGTALPGEFGDTVIFGHSMLPILYNPKNYHSIFSLIPTLAKGDKVHVYFDGIEYVYEVFSYREVKPEEVNVLEQRFDEQHLSLITCVPAGTYLRRGIIKARLVKI